MWPAVPKMFTTERMCSGRASEGGWEEMANQVGGEPGEWGIGAAGTGALSV